jgi:hypothetical protein
MPNAIVRANARPMPEATNCRANTTAADPVDPIFAAIEAHRAAWAPYEAALKRTGSRLCQPQALEDVKDVAGDTEMAAANELLATTPTTLVGLGELLRYAAEMDPGSTPDTPADFKSLRRCSSALADLRVTLR